LLSRTGLFWPVKHIRKRSDCAFSEELLRLVVTAAADFTSAVTSPNQSSQLTRLHEQARELLFVGSGANDFAHKYVMNGLKSLLNALRDERTVEAFCISAPPVNCKAESNIGQPSPHCPRASWSKRVLVVFVLAVT
jgi:hypothetical protein